MTMTTTPAIWAQALLEVHRAKKLNRRAVRNFFDCVRRERHAGWIPEIIRRFGILLDRHWGRTRVHVCGAHQEAKKFIPKIKRTFGHRAAIEFTVHPALIGGIRLEINDEVIIDASVQAQLEHMFSP